VNIPRDLLVDLIEVIALGVHVATIISHRRAVVVMQTQDSHIVNPEQITDQEDELPFSFKYLS